MQMQVLIPDMPGVAVETVRSLIDERTLVDQGSDPEAYHSLAKRFAAAGMIAAANRLLDRARFYAKGAAHGNQ